MKMNFYYLTKDQSSIIKGLCMAILVLHNYLHWSFGIGENEMSFESDRIFKLLDILRNDYSSFPNGILSYFGFYALELFIFISGFGLAKQYVNNGYTSYLSFTVPKIIKVYTLLAFGILLYALLFFHNPSLRWSLRDIAYILLMTNNFSFESIFLYVGPWWYFSLSLQLYLLFPLLCKPMIKYGRKAFVAMTVMSYILIFAAGPLAEKYNFPIYGNAVGHLPEFMLGIALAMYDRMVLGWKTLLAAAFVFGLSNFYLVFFPFSFLCATILMLAMVHPLISIRNLASRRILMSLGTISMFMFLMNGPLRLFTFSHSLHKSYIVQFAMSIGHLLFVILFSYLISFVYKKTLEPLSNSLVKTCLRILQKK